MTNPSLATGNDAQVLEIPSAHAAARTFGALAAVFVAIAALEVSLFVPAVARTLHVSPVDGAVACGLAIVGATIATVAYRLTGPSRIYLWAEYLESVLSAAGYSYLIHASGTPHSAFWFIYLVHCFLMATSGTSLRNTVLLGAAPSAVALGFLVQGQIAAAVASLVAGAFGVMLYLMIAKAFDELEAARRREARLRTDLAELSVSRERDRIARDLHDSIGAQLSGLVSRVRGFASGSKTPLAPAELETMERRVLDAIEELRDVVLALRRKPASFEEAAEHLSKRCREVCGSVEFDLSVEGAPDPRLLDAVYTDLARMVFELVRSVVRRARAKKIQVRIQAADGLRLCVLEDRGSAGAGDLDPGTEALSHVRRRVEELGGDLHVTSDAGSSRVEIHLPAPRRD